jgi:GT2 family glycosyltransferase
LIRVYQQRMPQLRWVAATEKHNQGYALNVGVRAARGDAFIFCDADDIAAPGWLAAMAEALQTHDLVAGAIEEERLNANAVWRRPTLDSFTQPHLGFLPRALGCNQGYSRGVFESVGGVAEDAPGGEDTEFSWRVQLAGYPLYYEPRAVMHYRHRESFKGAWRQFKSYAIAEVRLYKEFAAYGMPRSSFRAALKRYRWLVHQAVQLRLWRLRSQSPEQLKRNQPVMRWWLWTALCLGRIQGSLRYRTLFL